MKTVLFHGLTAGAFASLSGILYNSIYSNMLFVDFSVVINTPSIIGTCVLAALLASVGHFILSKKMSKGADVLFNIIFILITFASLVGPFGYQLPFEVEAPEMFLGLSIPMHFLPPLFWLGTKPLFYSSAELVNKWDLKK